MNSTVSIANIKTTRGTRQPMMGFMPHVIRVANRRPPSSQGACEMPILCDAEPYMNLLSAIDSLVRVMRPFMHVPLVGNALAPVVEQCRQLRDSVAYYERNRKAA